MSWYQKVLHDKKREIVSSALFAVIFGIAVTAWHYLAGQSFGWQNIAPIEQPGLLPRLFYSALVFIGPGWFLYHKLKLWKFLYEPYRGGGRKAYREYKKLKVAVWWGLILLMYFVIVPFVVHILNAIISFLYNAFNLILYLSPPLGMSALVFLGVVYFRTGRVKKLR